MPIRIVLVDDNVRNHELYTHYLSIFKKAEVIGHAYNGEEAIVLCRSMAIDAILMDIEMPVMDGVEATKAIHREFPDIAIIGLTGFDDLDRIGALINAGAYGYVTKSDNIKKLLDMIYKSTGVTDQID
jgi:DNA-binding NarL/FixJ family response regulator